MASILKRFSHRAMVAGAAALLTIGSFAVAQEFRGDHPDTYVVKRGDTLWDIAGTFLKKPWLWPEIWQANPQIQNPHLIYPGDVISLAYLDRVGVGVVPGPRTEGPIGAIPLSDILPYLKDLRVVDSFRELPYVVGQEADVTRAIRGMKVYVRGLNGAEVGQRFAVVRPMQRYTRITERNCCDLTSIRDFDYRGRQTPGFGTSWSEAASAESDGEVLGHELWRVNAGNLVALPQGEAEVSTILLDDPNTEVRVGDRIIPIDLQSYDLQFVPHAPKRELDYDKTRVLAVAGELISAGPRDVIAISAGSADGIDNGTVLSIWRQGSKVTDTVANSVWRGEETVRESSKIRLPNEYAGHVMIFRTFDKVSYGLVMDSVKQTSVGNLLQHPDAKY